MFHDTTRVPLDRYLTDEITDRALSFIERHGDRPFFLEVAYNAVHWPFQPPDTPPTDEERRAGRQLPPMPGDTLPVTRPTYVRMLERADEGVGKILAALEKRGLSTRHIPSGWNGHSTRAARSGEWRGPSGVLACAPTGSPDVGSQIRTLEARHRGRLGPPF